jgi:hypothetical protein
MAVPHRMGIRVTAAAMLILPLLLLASATAAAEPPRGATWVVTVSGKDVTTATANSPLRLSSEQLTRLVLTVDNRSTQELRVRTIRLRGNVFGLTFFSYATRLDLVVLPGETAERRIDLDLEDLARQATGLIPAEVQLVDQDRAVLDRRPFVSHVDGSPISVYGVFGVAIAAITALLVVGLLLALSQRRLPGNRWRRGLQFLPVGLGLGLTATFTLSALSWLTPSPSRWVPLVVGLGVAALLVGYFLPGQVPEPDEFEDRRPEEGLESDAVAGDAEQDARRGASG